MPHTAAARASGKIILSGEYAVLFGHRGIAVPSHEEMGVRWTEDKAASGTTIVWEGNSDPKGITYARSVLQEIEAASGPMKGTLVIESTLPLGKGMGSSTALVIAMCRSLLGPDCAKIALRIENVMNPGSSGIDFAVIWEERPVLFKQNDVPEVIDLDRTQLEGAILIDSGTPTEPTPELVAWIRSREKELQSPLAVIGDCTERILKGEPLRSVMRDHHRAQVALGVVTPEAQAIVAKVETDGGCAKVIGAGGRSGGSGMILALPAPSA